MRIRMPSASEICVSAFDLSYARAYRPTMAPKVLGPEEVRAIMKQLGLNQTELANRIGVTQSTVSRWLKGSTPEPDHQAALLILVDEPELALHGLATREWSAQTVPVVGYVGAGWTIIVYDESQGELDRVAAPPDVTDATVAVRMRGESMGPFFDKWLVFYDEVRRPFTNDLLDRVCVVGLVGGAVMIKKVTKGQKEGHFNLLSHFDPPIYDAEVDWAAEVKWMGPS